MIRYYLDFDESVIWMHANNGSFVCIAAAYGQEHEIGYIIQKPILPGHWKPLAGSISINDIVLSKTKPAVY